MNEENKNIKNIKKTIHSMPEKPGCYIYFDENQTIIYVGKAKNLKKRVSSYFNKIPDNIKTKILVKKIHEIQYLVVDSEFDALLLENNMIKQHQPRYNILLKDDKTYPWIVIKNEPFPRVYSTRTVLKDNSHYYGPYPSVPTMKLVLQLIRNLYPIRTCKYPLTKENIQQKRFKVCLQYHIKNCLGPCEALQNELDYNANIVSIKEILDGNINLISGQLLEKMNKLAEKLQFEEAQLVKEKYNLLENFKSKFVIVNPKLNNIDVFSYEETSSTAYVNFLRVKSGLIVQGYTIELKKKLDEPKEELFALAIIELKTRFKSDSQEIIVSFIPNINIDNITFLVPQRGDKKKLLELSERNVKQYKFEQLKQAEKLNPEQRSTKILIGLQRDLHITELPVHIECFDNSNIQGSSPVSACVVFKKGKPSKKDYRHFNIKTVVGPDDFSSMRETVFRRYKRLKEENQTFPQLIIVDGGKGQLSAATDALKSLDLYGKIAIIGIAKRLEEIYFPNDSIPLYLDKNSESLKLIQQLRDEAHRFGITFHRLKRSIRQIASELDDIKGIGEVAKEKLLLKYKSVKQIKKTPKEEIEKLLGIHKTKLLFEGLKIDKI